MRMTMVIDDEFLAHAIELTGIQNKSQLVREGLKILIAREAGRRLALMGGSDPLAWAPGRRRQDPE